LDNSGILFLAFNRPESLHKLVEDVLKTTEIDIYISIDKANSERNIQVREIATRFKKNYPNRVNLNIMVKNHGVRLGVIKGIDWFFNNVEYGIILEEDLEILVKNPNDLFVLIINFLKANKNSVFNLSTFVNMNEQLKKGNNDIGFYKNQDFYMWGWATHKTVWSDFKINIDNKNNIVSFIKSIPKFAVHEKIYWLSINRLIGIRQIDSWGYSFLFYSTIKSNLYTPSKSIVRNVGLYAGSNYSKLSIFNQDLKNINIKKYFVSNKKLKILEYNKILFRRNKKIRHNINYYSIAKAVFWNIIPIRNYIKKIKK
jgi:hypothetical protein